MSTTTAAAAPEAVATTVVSAVKYSEWRGNDSSIIHVPYEYKSQLWIEQRLWNPVLVHSLFNSHWFWSVYIVLGYVFAIHALEHWMQLRKPFALRGTLAAWNSIVTIWRFGEELCTWYPIDPSAPPSATLLTPSDRPPSGLAASRS